MSDRVAKIKILVVGDPGSIHTARFVSLLQEIGYYVEVFQSEFLYTQDEHLHQITLHVGFPYADGENGNIIKGHHPLTDWLIKKLRRWPDNQILIPIAINQYFSPEKRAKHLSHLLEKFRPDIIFSLKMQNDGYTVLKAKEILGRKFKAKWVHFNWGTDIEFFGKNPKYKKKHLPQIKKLLASCDFYLADCERDVKQAKKLGFKGVSLGACLAHGGFDLVEFAKIRKKYHQRNLIIIKGREGSYVGRAFNILSALRQISPLLKKYKIKIIYCNPEVQAVISFLKKFEEIDYEIVKWLPYQKLLNLYAQSRLTISATDVEGTPSFLIESMALGAFPIHSDMVSIREWVENGQNGLLFPVDDINKLKSCITKALADNKMIEKARFLNWQIAQQKMDRDKIRNHLQDLIENQILQQK